MYIEELTHKKLNTALGLLITFALVIGILTAMFFVQVIQAWLGIYWLQLILIAAVMLLALYIIKKYLTDYIYLIEKDRITFGRRIGKREKELLFVPLRDIVSMGDFSKYDGKLKEKKKFKFTFKNKENWYIIWCTGCYIILSPTEKYLDCLTEATGRKNKDEPERNGSLKDE